MASRLAGGGLNRLNLDRLKPKTKSDPGEALSCRVVEPESPCDRHWEDRMVSVGCSHTQADRPIPFQEGESVRRPQHAKWLRTNQEAFAEVGLMVRFKPTATVPKSTGQPDLRLEGQFKSAKVEQRLH